MTVNDEHFFDRDLVHRMVEMNVLLPIETSSRLFSLIQQRNVSRIVKGAIAGGFHVSTVKVDKDGAIVLYSAHPEREECEEPRLPLKANEWDEVLKK